MTDSTYFVKSTHLRAFIRSFNTLQKSYRHIEDLHVDVWCWKKYFLTNLRGHFPTTFVLWLTDSIYMYFVKSTSLRVFTGSFQHFVDMLQIYWRYTCGSLMLKNRPMLVNICMKFHEDVLNGFKVIEQTWFCHRNCYVQSSKGHN